MARKPSLSLETIHAPQRQWDSSHTPFRYNRLKKLRILTIPKNFPSALFQLANQGLIAHIRSFAGPDATYKFGMQPLSKATNPARCPPPEANRPERAPGALLLRALSLIMENNPVLTEWLVSVAASPFRVRCIRLRLWPHWLEGGR